MHHHSTVEATPSLHTNYPEKNFVAFMDALRRMGKDWLPDVNYYKDTIAKAILFKTTQKIVSDCDIEAYRPNVVTYTMAILVAQTAGKLDLRGIWDNQAVPEPVQRTLKQWAPKVYRTIVETAGARNVGEWSKNDACWVAVRALDPKLPAEVARRVLANAEGDGGDEGRLTREDLTNIAAVKRIAADTWMEVFTRAIESRRLSLGQRNACATMSSLAAAGWLQDPTAKHAKAALASYERIMQVD